MCVIRDVWQLLSETWEPWLEMYHSHHVMWMQNRKYSSRCERRGGKCDFHHCQVYGQKSKPLVVFLEGKGCVAWCPLHLLMLRPSGAFHSWTYRVCMLANVNLCLLPPTGAAALLSKEDCCKVGGNQTYATKKHGSFNQHVCQLRNVAFAREQLWVTDLHQVFRYAMFNFASTIFEWIRLRKKRSLIEFTFNT